MQEVKGKYNTAKVFTDSLEESGREQIERLWDQPYAADSKIRMMLDVHAGAGCTIGTTMTIADKICPNLVGVDIGCGMETLIDTDVMILRKGSVSARKGENFWFQSIWEIEVSSVLENGMKTGTPFLNFGDFIKFYEFYYKVMKIKMPISIPILKMLKNLRNACAHNNCLIADLQTNLTFIPAELGIFVSNIKTISKKQRQKKLSCLAMLEFVSTIYALKTIATKTVISKHRKALRSLFTKRMLKHKDYFSGNDLIKSSYNFAYKVFSVL